MPTLREVKLRIDAIKKIEKIANALQVVALTQLRKIESKTENARFYFDATRELTFDISKNLVYEAHPLLKARKDIRNYAVIIFSSDKGLCGDFNTNIEKEFKNFLEEKNDTSINIISIGKKGSYFLKKEKMKIHYGSLSSIKNIDYIKVGLEVSSIITKMFLAKKIDEAVIIYNQFKRQFLGKPKILKILPIKTESFSVKRVRDYIYEPTPYSVLEGLLKEYLANQISQAILESNAAEAIARMLAMKQARDNANETIEKLNLSYHKQRQMSITRELIDITTAANV